MGPDLLVHAGRVDLLLAEVHRAPTIGKRRYWLDALERALFLTDQGALSESTLDSAKAAGIDRHLIANLEEGRNAPFPAHHVLVAFHTEPDLAFARGAFVVRKTTTRIATALHLSDGARDAIASAFEGVARAYAPFVTPSDFSFAAAQPAALSTFHIEGDSLAAAAALSAAALWLHRPVLPGTVVAGSLVGERILPVGKLSGKIAGVTASRCDVHRWIVPLPNRGEAETALRDRCEVVGVSDLGELLDVGLGPTARRAAPALEVESARRAFRAGWDGYRWPTQREPLERLVTDLPSYRPDLRVEALTMLGAVHRHLGSTELSLSYLDQAVRVERENGSSSIPASPLSGLYRHRALTLRQLARFREATEAAEEAVRHADESRLVEDRLRSHGSAGLVLTSAGNAQSAIRHHSAALALARNRAPEQVPRTLGYLTETLSRAGASRDAADAYREGLLLVAQGEGTEENVAPYSTRRGTVGGKPHRRSTARARRQHRAECDRARTGARPSRASLPWNGVRPHMRNRTAWLRFARTVSVRLRASSSVSHITYGSPQRLGRAHRTLSRQTHRQRRAGPG